MKSKTLFYIGILLLLEGACIFALAIRNNIPWIQKPAPFVTAYIVAKECFKQEHKKITMTYILISVAVALSLAYLYIIIWMLS